MEKFKKGDRVRVCWIDDYTRDVMIHQGIALPTGRTGTVVETRFNPNMACYGEGNEVLVDMDNGSKNVLWCDKNLELIA